MSSMVWKNVLRWEIDQRKRKGERLVGLGRETLDENFLGGVEF